MSDMTNIPTKTDVIDKFFDYSINLSTHTIYIGSSSSFEGFESGVDAKMAEQAIKGLHILDNLNNPITVLANIIGGDVYHGMAIYDAIRTCKNRVSMKVYGYAMSMGSIIMQAADERLMSENSKIMIHYGTFNMGGEHAPSVYKWIEENKKIDQWMEQLYLNLIKEKQPNFKLKTLQDWLTTDKILSAREAVDLNLADGIF